MATTFEKLKINLNFQKNHQKTRPFVCILFKKANKISLFFNTKNNNTKSDAKVQNKNEMKKALSQKKRTKIRC